MTELDAGHTYTVKVLDGLPGQTDVIQFVKREGDKYPGNKGHHCGTTMQEVLRACICRAMYVNNQIPCKETENAINAMMEAVWLFEIRAARVHNRQFVGGADQAVFGLACDTCGHVQCKEHK